MARSVSATPSAATARLSVAAPCLVALALAAPASAQKASFQDFFFDVCAGGASGALATRCTQTPGGTGDLSSDSEESLNPSQSVVLNEAAVARQRALASEVQERLEERRGGEGDGGQLLEGRLGVFLNGRAEFFDRNHSNNERGYDGYTAGFQLGADYRIGDQAFVGALFGYDYTDSDFDSDSDGVNFFAPGNAGSVDADHYLLSLFGSWYVIDALWLDGSVSYGHTEFDFRRKAVFQEAGRVIPQTDVRADSDTNGDEVSVSLGTGYDLQRGALSLTPYLRATFVYTNVDGYSESDSSGLQMHVEGQNQTSLTSVVGIRSAWAIGTPWGVLIPQLRFEYEHEFERDRQTIDTSYLQDPNDATFQVRGDRPDRDYFNAGAGAMMVLPNGWSTFADYEGLFGNRFLERHRVTVGVRKEL